MRTIIPPQARLIPPQAKRVFRGVLYDVYQWPQTLFDGTIATFEMLRRPDTVLIMVVKDGRLVVLHEQQPGREPRYCFPGGRHDNEIETELQAAQRELLEETGLSCKTWKLYDVWQPQGHIERFVYLFIASDVIAPKDPRPDAGERIAIQYLDLASVRKLALPYDRKFQHHLLQSITSFDDLLALPQYQP